METVGMIASLVAAFAAVATLVFTVRTSKWSIRRRIERKQSRRHDIDNFDFLYKRQQPFAQSPYMEEKWKLQEEIEELHKDL